MTDIASLNIRINTLEAKAAKQDLDRLTGAGQKAEHQMGTMSKAAARLGTALAAAFATYKITGFLKEIMLAGARFETLGIVMENVGRNAGYSATEMHKYANEVKNAGIQMDISREVVIKLTQAKIQLSNAEKLARVAQDAAVIGNLNSSEALERMIIGIQQADILILRNIGLNVDFQKAYEKTAKSLNKTTASLTESEKAQSRVSEVMLRGADIAGTYEKAMETAGKQITSFPRYLNDFKIQMGEAFNPATADAVKSLTETMKMLSVEIVKPENQAALSEISQGFADWVVENNELIKQNLPEIIKAFGEAAKTAASATGDLWDTIKGIKEIYDSLPDAIKGPAGIGLVGTMMFGGSVGKVLFALTAVNNGLKVFNLDIGHLSKTWREGGEAIDNILDVITGKRDWNTGELKKLEKTIKATTPAIDSQTNSWKKHSDAVNEAKKGLGDLFKDYEKEAFDIASKYIENQIALKEKQLAEYKKAEGAKVEVVKIREKEILKLRKSYADQQNRLIDKALADVKKTYERQLANIDGALESHFSEIDIMAKEAWDSAVDVAEEYAKQQERYAKKVTDAHADMSKTIQGHMADIIADWDNAGDMLVNIAKRTAAEMAAAFLTQQFIMPVVQNIGGSMGMMWNNVPVSAMGSQDGVTGQSGMGFPPVGAMQWAGSNIPGMGALGSAMAWQLPGSGLGSLGAVGHTTLGAGLGYGAMGGLGYQYLGGAIGLPQSKYSGLTAGVGGMLGGSYAGSALGAMGMGKIGASLGSFLPGIGTAIGAILGGLAGSLFGGSKKEPKVRVLSGQWGEGHGQPGELNSDFGYRTWIQDVEGSGNRSEIGNAMMQVFDAQFQAIEDATSWGLKEALAGTSFFMSTAKFKDYDNDLETAFTAMSDDVFRQINQSLVSAMGLSSVGLDTSFFEGLRADGETLLQTFARFATIAESIDDFSGRMDQQVADGKTAEQAFGNLVVIAETLQAVTSATDAIGTSSGINNVRNMIQAQADYMKALKDAVATQDELAQVQVGISQQIGASISGLTADSLQSVLASGGDITGVLQATVKNTAAQTIAGLASESIMAEYGNSLNQLIGDAFKNINAEDLQTSDLIDALNSIINDFDWDSMDAEVSAAADAINDFIAEIEQASKSVDELKNTYLDYLQKEIDIRQTAFDNAKNVLEEYIDGEERLIDARRQAAKSIDDFINGLMRSTQAPVQSLEFFEKRYAQLLSDAQTAGPDDIGNAVSALTSFTSQYLDFAGAYGGQDYNTLFNSVVSDLESVGADQLDQADVQTRALQDIKDLIGDTDGKLFDLNEAVQSFVDAKIGLDESAWMVQELNSLASIDSNLLLLYDAQRAYYGKVDTSKEPQIPTPEMDYVQYLYSTIGRSGFGSDMGQIDPGGYQYWSKASKTMSPEELSKAFYNAVDEYAAQNPDYPRTPTPETDYVQYLYSTIGRSNFGSEMNQIDPAGYQYWIEASKTMPPEELSKAFYNAVHEYIAQNPDDPYTQFVSPYMGYADGGIISGPTSGYQLPGATFHGTEAIVPLKNGSIPVDIRSGNQDIRVVVKIGNRELKDITTEIIRTDPEAQGQIRRVANG